MAEKEERWHSTGEFKKESTVYSTCLGYDANDMRRKPPE